MYTAYEILKFWLPIISGFTMVIGAYFSVVKKVSAWADKLLHNHLSHIESAVANNATEAAKTNDFLQAAACRESSVAQKVDMVQSTLHDQNRQQADVWKEIVEALTLLKERTR